MSEQPIRLELLNLTVDIVAAHTSNNTVSISDLPTIIQQVFTTLAALSVNSGQNHLSIRPKPAVSINKSITDDYIVCLEDGKKLQMLKRHLKTVYNLSVEQYRERWGLPVDYPVVAPNYAKRRSEIAKNSGLGMSPHKRGRKKKKENNIEVTPYGGKITINDIYRENRRQEQLKEIFFPKDENGNEVQLEEELTKLGWK